MGAFVTVIKVAELIKFLQSLLKNKDVTRFLVNQQRQVHSLRRNLTILAHKNASHLYLCL